MIDRHAIALSASAPVSHDPGVHECEADVGGTRWALMEYSPAPAGEGRCNTPHGGYVLSGSISYAVDDAAPPLVVV